MEAYSDFAYLYDKFMEDVPYDEWAELLCSLLRAYGNNVNSLLDIGCGTGTLTRIMAEKGYEMTGLDISADMLSVASSKEGEDILYILQDMTDINLLEEADAAYSICDCVNYLITNEDIVECFKSVERNLKKDGLFIFDFNTIYKYETVIGDTTIAENADDASFIWENYYSKEDHINEYDVTFFVLEENDLYRRFEETHIQRGYELQEIKEFINTAGLKFVTAIDENTHKEPTNESERIFVVARK